MPTAARRQTEAALRGSDDTDAPAAGYYWVALGGAAAEVVHVRGGMVRRIGVKDRWGFKEFCRHFRTTSEAFTAVAPLGYTAEREGM